MCIKSIIRNLLWGTVFFTLLYVGCLIMMNRNFAAAIYARENQTLSAILSEEVASNSYFLTAFARSFVASNDIVYRQKYNELVEIVQGKRPRPQDKAIFPGQTISMLELYGKVGFSAEEKALLAKSTGLSMSLVELEDEAMNLVERAAPDQLAEARLAAVAMLHSPEYLEAAAAIQAPVKQFMQALNERQAQAINQTGLRAKLAQSALIGLTVVVVLIALGVVFWIKRRVVGDLSTIVNDLDGAGRTVYETTAKISQGSTKLAAGVSQQAASLEETSAALDEMSSMTQVTADNAKKTNETTQETNELLVVNGQEIENMNKAMAEISESATQIGKIIKTIESIAFQTNLLALNAAVEAARAGEMGKGFAVVADEVHTLAQNSAQAANDTNYLIETAIDRVGRGTTIANRLEASFNQIKTGAKEASGLVAEISTAAQEQAQGVS